MQRQIHIELIISTYFSMETNELPFKATSAIAGDAEILNYECVLLRRTTTFLEQKSTDHYSLGLDGLLELLLLFPLSIYFTCMKKHGLKINAYRER